MAATLAAPLCNRRCTSPPPPPSDARTCAPFPVSARSLKRTLSPRRQQHQPTSPLPAPLIATATQRHRWRAAPAVVQQREPATATAHHEVALAASGGSSDSKSIERYNLYHPLLISPPSSPTYAGIYIYTYTYTHIYMYTYTYTRACSATANPSCASTRPSPLSPAPLNSHHASILPVGGRVGEWIMGERPALLEGP